MHQKFKANLKKSLIVSNNLKPTALIILFFLSIANVFSQTFQLQVNIKGFSDNGIAYVMLYKEGEDFNHASKTCIKKKMSIKNNTCVLKFSSLKKGKYAIMVYHDMNKNGILDTNFIGIPKEGIGASNKMKGIPSFKKAAIFIDKNKSIFINIKYL